MDLNKNRGALREVCRFFGGIRAVANAANIDDGNLSRWFRGHPTLSEEKLAGMLDVLALPNGQARCDVVHEWELKSVMRGDLASAFRLYFPSGAQVATASWSLTGFRELVRRVKDKEKTPEIVAISDGVVRAVIRFPSNVVIQEKNMGDVLSWKNGQRENSLLNITKGALDWCDGPLSIEEFNRGWGQEMKLEPSDQDVLQVIKRMGIANSEAIRRLQI